MRPTARLVPRAAAGLVTLIGAAGLAGWVFQAPALRSLVPGAVAMKANTGVAFILSGVALWLLGVETPTHRQRRLGRVGAALVGLIGLASLTEHLSGADFGVDEFLFRDEPGAVATASPGRMAPAAAVAFALVGAGLWLSPVLKLARGVHALALATGFLGLFSGFSYLYGATPELYQLTATTQMALHTCLAFTSLAAGLLALHPREGLTGAVTSPLAGGLFARRLLWFVIAVPVVLDWVIHQGQHARLYHEDVASVLRVMTMGAALFLIVLANAFRLNRVDVQRAEAQTALQQHLAELERLVRERTAELSESESRYRLVAERAVEAIVSCDGQGLIIAWNQAAEDMFGYTQDEALGLSVRNLMPEMHREAHDAGLERLAAGGPPRVTGQIMALTGLHKAGREFPVELSLSSWRTPKGLFFTSVMRDVSERREAEAKQARLISELEAALANVKTLRGLLPICASCKRIRDDAGYWRQVETFIKAHTEAEFTHGLCPDCLPKYFPGAKEEASPAK